MITHFKKIEQVICCTTTFMWHIAPKYNNKFSIKDLKSCVNLATDFFEKLKKHLRWSLFSSNADLENAMEYYFAEWPKDLLPKT